MLLHSVANMHPHEYSAPASPEARSSFRRPLVRSAFSTPASRPNTVYEHPTSTTIVDQKRPVSAYRPDSFQSELTVSFEEPEVDTMSEDARSVANSETSEVTAVGGRRRKRVSRTSTAFHLALPAPTLATQKQKIFQVRPKLLLQLQQLSLDARPRPVIDVLPSFVFAPRLLKKFPRMFRGRDKLGANDVMVVRSEDYDVSHNASDEDHDSDEEGGLASRDLLAVICQVGKTEAGCPGVVEITLKDGSVWTACVKQNGSFEFVNVDHSGVKTTARWVRKVLARSTGDQSTGSVEYKYIFSIIDPNSRRHPVLATITRSKLDIPDSYTSVSHSAAPHLPTSPLPTSVGHDIPPIDEVGSLDRTTYAIDENLKSLIQVTGIWVALRQNWSPYFSYNDSNSALGGNRNASHGRVRSLSMAPDACRPSLSGSLSPDSSHSTFGSVTKMRRKTQMENQASPSSPNGKKSSGPKRAVSTGTAFMQRAAARKASNGPSNINSDTEGEGSQLQKHVATDMTDLKAAHRMSEPPLTLPGSPVAVLDASTKVQGHRSTFCAPCKPKTSEKTTVDSVELAVAKHMTDYGEKSKGSRWRKLTKLFSRPTRHTLDPGAETPA
ncbi:hypothetical protein BP5796_00189 [Coleophoma crateriformis]|uniref:Uncharacterized protein n=1 Tax=Coleophoma crateriformis TaxID=565419 RepID=A0A3D8T7A2_9HELO|nr:hypothetical protein BP5796_00189 [Coleophoma crateriformis]